jgi:hypothetical protein
MTHKQVLEILQWSRENNVMRLKVEDVEVEFAPSALEPEASDLDVQALVNGIIKKEQTDSTQELTERDELLYYSS